MQKMMSKIDADLYENGCERVDRVRPGQAQTPRGDKKGGGPQSRGPELRGAGSGALYTVSPRSPANPVLKYINRYIYIYIYVCV